MTLIDIGISFVVFLGLWRGFNAGAVKTATSLIAWLLALIVASKTVKQVAPLFENVVSDPILQVAAAFLVLALIVVTVVHLLARAVVGTLKALHLGFLDRMLGGVLGSLVGVLKVLIVLGITSPFLIHLPTWQESALAQSLLPYAPMAKQLLQEAFGTAWQQIQNPYS
ncbi:CvpA family protein [Moraxella nasovis]|uniref:CvpA family protein n=1 Tax=Moraxella nasovis TaxID=2904121 RepID=UPI001F6189CA|nr:CvpA family protein [Moraxella nasovis]UNU73589.1 CvpA family protein [Moraxella nasovis]